MGQSCRSKPRPVVRWGVTPIKPDLVCAHRDTAHRHRPPAKTGCRAIDPAHLAAVFLACVRCRTGLLLGCLSASLLLQPPIGTGLPVTNQATPIFRLVVGPCSLPFGERKRPLPCFCGIGSTLCLRSRLANAEQQRSSQDSDRSSRAPHTPPPVVGCPFEKLGDFSWFLSVGLRRATRPSSSVECAGSTAMPNWPLSPARSIRVSQVPPAGSSPCPRPCRLRPRAKSLRNPLRSGDWRRFRT